MDHILFNNPDEWVSLAIIENGIPKLDTRPLTWLNENGNPLSKEEIISLGYYGVKNQPYSFDPETEKVIELPIEEAIIDEDSKEVTRQFQVVPLSFNELTIFNRQKRNHLIQLTDVLVFPDLWESYDNTRRETIRAYRQALRDVPQQPDFPYTINWPSDQGVFHTEPLISFD